MADVVQYWSIWSNFLPRLAKLVPANQCFSRDIGFLVGDNPSALPSIPLGSLRYPDVRRLAASWGEVGPPRPMRGQEGFAWVAAPALAPRGLAQEPAKLAGPCARLRVAEGAPAIAESLAVGSGCRAGAVSRRLSWPVALRRWALVVFRVEVLSRERADVGGFWRELSRWHSWVGERVGRGSPQTGRTRPLMARIWTKIGATGAGAILPNHKVPRRSCGRLAGRLRSNFRRPPFGFWGPSRGWASARLGCLLFMAPIGLVLGDPPFGAWAGVFDSGGPYSVGLGYEGACCLVNALLRVHRPDTAQCVSDASEVEQARPFRACFVQRHLRRSIQRPEAEVARTPHLDGRSGLR